MRVPVHKRYATVLADPPWAYANKRTGGNHTSGSAQKYATLTPQEIRDLPVYPVTAPSALTYLWVPVPLLPWGPEVLEAWGTPYRTALFWRKIHRRGMGYWYRNQVEILMLGVRGVTPYRTALENVVTEAPTQHSHKPDTFYDIMIEPFAPRPWLELFATERRTGWTSVGLSLGTEVRDWLMRHAHTS